MVSSVNSPLQGYVNPFQQRSDSQVRSEERKTENGVVAGAKDETGPDRKQDNFAVAASRDTSRSGQNASGSRGSLFDVTV